MSSLDKNSHFDYDSTVSLNWRIKNTSKARKLKKFSTIVDNIVEKWSTTLKISKEYGNRMNDFELTKNYLKNILDEPTFEKWILPLSYIGTKNNIAFVGSPDKKKTIWIKNNLLDNINKHTKREFNFILKVVPLYDDNEEDDENIIPTIDDEIKYTTNYSSNLQSRYTFENFVQVDQNRMAYSFARNVSEFPGQNYNPLYIYSDVGLGKTHLLYAIGNHIVKNDKKNAGYLFHHQ